MRYKVTKTRTIEGTNLTYFDVDFYTDLSVLVHQNDFVMQLPVTRRTYTGSDEDVPPYDPELYKTTDLSNQEIIDIVHRNIIRYFPRRLGELDNRNPGDFELDYRISAPRARLEVLQCLLRCNI